LRLGVTSVFRKGYFEFIANFAHRKIAKGMLNQIIHTASSNVLQIAASDLSGNKLILTIFFVLLWIGILRGGIDPALLETILMGEIVRSGQNED
jgi:hypothetical protein